MSANVGQLFKDALSLPEKERAELAALLIESLEPGCEVDAAPAWEAEILRRVQDLDSGAVQPVPWSEARRRIVGEDNDPSRP